MRVGWANFGPEETNPRLDKESTSTKPKALQSGSGELTTIVASIKGKGGVDAT